MVLEEYQTERLILRRFKKEDAKRLYQSWNNPQSFRFNEIPKGRTLLEDGTIETGIEKIEEMAEYSWPSDWGQYYFVVVLKENGEIVGNCRFGLCSADPKVWDLGYNIVRADDKCQYSLEEIERAFQPNGLVGDEKYWGKGYASEIVEKIIEIAKLADIERLQSSAEILNVGSLKALIKNGFTVFDLDKDLDYVLTLDLTQEIQKLTKEDVVKVWDDLLKRAENDKIRYQQRLADNTKKHFAKAKKIWQEDRRLKEIEHTK